MRLIDQSAGGGIPRGFPLGRRRRGAVGVAVAVASAGFVVSLAGCGPNSLASNASPPQVQPKATDSAGGMAQQQANMSRSFMGGSFSFRTLDNPADPTFNQLLGANAHGRIAGYFGSGAAGHPNKGYVLNKTAAGFAITNENFPGSVQTQVTGLNGHGVTVGFWSGMNNANEVNDNTGFYDIGGSFHSVKFPAASNSTPAVNQLLGVNFQNVAVGFYNDAKGNSHGYTYNINRGRFHTVTVPGATSTTAAAINNRSDVAGFFTTAGGTTEGFLRSGFGFGHVYKLAFPGASMTQALGVNDLGEVVGVYTVGSGDNAATHGFIWCRQHGFRKVDDPQGLGTTTINGVNDLGTIVGFYTDGAGNTHGFAAAAPGMAMLPGLATGMTPTPSMSPTMSPSMTPTPSMSPTMTKAPTPSMSPTGSMPPTKPAPTATPSAVPSNLQPTHF